MQMLHIPDCVFYKQTGLRAIFFSISPIKVIHYLVCHNNASLAHGVCQEFIPTSFNQGALLLK